MKRSEYEKYSNEDIPIKIFRSARSVSTNLYECRYPYNIESASFLDLGLFVFGHYYLSIYSC